MHTAAFFIKYKIHHLVFWIMLFGLWYFLRYEDYSTTARAFQVTLIKVVDLALMITITNYILIPKLLYRKRYFLFTCCFVLLVVTSSVLKMQVLGRLMNNPALFEFAGNVKARIYDNVIPHFFLVIAGAAIKLMLDYGDLQQRMADTAREKAEAELNFLKSQINPHFLFNSLNSVYFLIDKSNPGARNALHKFSDMLRYQLYEMNDARIPIEKEIKYLQDYVDLQRLRTDENFEVCMEIAPSVKGFSIEPLLLIPFVENAFKHGVANDPKDPIQINIIANQKILHFSIRNKKNNNNKDQMGGVGLNNVERRLQLLYPDRYKLNIVNSPTHYTSELMLDI